MQRTTILYDATQAILSTFDLDEVLHRILAIARDHFRLENCTIFLLDTTDNSLYAKAHSGRRSDIDNLRISITKGIIGRAAQSKRPVYVTDVTKDDGYIAGVPSTRSELALPLIERDQVVGVMDFQSDELDHFDQETIDLLTLFAAQASIGVQNARLYSMLKHRAAQLEAINSFAKQTTLEVDIRDLLGQLCAQLPQSFPVDHVAVLLLDTEGHLVPSSQFGTLRPKFTEEELGAVLQDANSTGKLLKRVAIDSEIWFEGAKSEVCLPLVSFGRPLGVLLCASTQRGGFKENDIQALESVADILATAVQNASHLENVRELAYRDGLTGIFNRRQFESKIREELARTGRYGGNLSVLMIDIDHFKLINDEFGHLLGDEVLKQVANIFGRHLRKVDITCRYGGEEFAIILPATRLPSAHAVAEKLRRAVETYEFPGVPRPVTISIGVAEFPTHGEERDELVSAADAALYQAKQGGRNRVCCWHVKSPA